MYAKKERNPDKEQNVQNHENKKSWNSKQVGMIWGGRKVGVEKTQDRNVETKCR